MKYSNAHKLEIIDVNQICTTGKDIHQLCSTSFVSKVLDLIRSKQYTLQISDASLWYDCEGEADTFNPNEPLSMEQLSDNIENAIGFGWSEQLSRYILKHCGNLQERFPNIASVIKADEEERLQSAFQRMKETVDTRLKAFEDILSATHISEQKAKRKRQRQALRKQCSNIYCRNKDITIYGNTSVNYDIVEEFLRADVVSYLPIYVSSVKELTDIVFDLEDNDELPDYITNHFRHEIDMQRIGQYENQFLGPEITKIKELQTKLNNL